LLGGDGMPRTKQSRRFGSMPTVSGICKDLINSMPTTKSLIASVVAVFSSGPVTTVEWRKAFCLLWSTRAIEADPGAVPTPEFMTDMWGAGTYFMLQSGGHKRTKSKEARDVLARMTGDGLYVLLLLCVCRHRAERIWTLPLPEYIRDKQQEVVKVLLSSNVPEAVTLTDVCLSCCIAYAALVTKDPATHSRRTVIGSSGVAAYPCLTCSAIKPFMKFLPDGPDGKPVMCHTCNGTGTITTCTNKTCADSMGGKSKRCACELVSYDLAGQVLVLPCERVFTGGEPRFADAIAMCPWCACRFKYTTESWVDNWIACAACIAWRRDHGAFPNPSDIVPLVPSTDPVEITARKDWLPFCCVCGAFVLSETKKAAESICVRVQAFPTDPRCRFMYLCKDHAYVKRALPGLAPVTVKQVIDAVGAPLDPRGAAAIGVPVPQPELEPWNDATRLKWARHIQQAEEEAEARKAAFSAMSVIKPGSREDARRRAQAPNLIDSHLDAVVFLSMLQSIVPFE
jgi:hypothetical protein